MTRYVLDTNVILSALLWPSSIPGQVFFRCLAEGTILISADLAVELSDVLGRDKFNRYVSRDDRESFLQAFVAEKEFVEITETIQACRDPKDDRILELAVNGAASMIVTGDQDLLAMNPFQAIPIITPAEWLKSFPNP